MFPNGGAVMSDRYVGTTKAAELLGLTNRRVVGLCAEGKLEGAFRDGRNWKIPEKSLHKYMETEGFSVHERHPSYGHKLPFAIGNTSYIEVSSESYYVDKTLLIRDLIDDHNMVTLFTRPRRFGKSLAINTIKTFFEKTEEDTARYFKDKKIWRCGEKYRAMQGKYPEHLKMSNTAAGKSQRKRFGWLCAMSICAIQNWFPVRQSVWKKKALSRN